MLFFVFFLTLILAGHLYAFWHIWCILPLSAVWKTLIISACVLAFSCLFLYLSPVQDKMPMHLARAIYEIGTSWIIILLYIDILFLIADLCKWFNIIPGHFLHNSLAGSIAAFLILFVVFFCGNVRYNHKQRKEMNLTSNKIHRPLKVVFVSDLHLGYHNPRSEFQRWVDMINAESPDYIMVAGDIIDGNMRPLLEEEMWESFKTLSAPVYACLGNHEYLAGKKEAESFYHEAGIHLLVDSLENNADICVVGRDDRSNKYRKPLKSILKKADRNKFKIVLDHQPYNLQESEEAHIDLQLSGHTHHGQVWPLNWITDAVYECAYGSFTKSGTNYYVSSGLGIWGGKFRIGTCSEYVVINLNTK